MSFSTARSTAMPCAWLFSTTCNSQLERPGERLAADSRYLDPSNGELRYRSAPSAPVDARDRRTFDRLQSHVADVNYPCVMARSVFNRDAFRMSTYGRLGEPGNAEMLRRDLHEFSSEFPVPVSGAVSFLACFDGPSAVDEASFERQLWSQLQSLHRVDRRYCDWAPDVDSDPASANFSFSVAGRGFFVIGMHPGASRLSRRTPMPVIVFNLHEQFVELRTTGKFEGIRDTVRSRDERLQGTVNPMASDFGVGSEAAQYSGRAVDSEWKCPLHVERS